MPSHHLRFSCEPRLTFSKLCSCTDDWNVIDSSCCQFWCQTASSDPPERSVGLEQNPPTPPPLQRPHAANFTVNYGPSVGTRLLCLSSPTGMFSSLGQFTGQSDAILIPLDSDQRGCLAVWWRRREHSGERCVCLEVTFILDNNQSINEGSNIQ